jgi:hypothetical protein
VAEITTNLSLASDPACNPIDPSPPDGRAMGIGRDPVISSLKLVTVYADNIDQDLGTPSAAMIFRLNDCPKHALALP